MRQTVFEYIAVNYNCMRRSSSIGYLSPNPSRRNLPLSSVSTIGGQINGVVARQRRNAGDVPGRTPDLGTFFKGVAGPAGAYAGTSIGGRLNRALVL
jgi:hypothetical protein